MEKVSWALIERTVGLKNYCVKNAEIEPRNRIMEGEALIMVDLTKEEKEYLLELLKASEGSLIDLKNWKEQTLLTEDEIKAEEMLIWSIKEKLNEDCD